MLIFKFKENVNVLNFAEEMLIQAKTYYKQNICSC